MSEEQHKVTMWEKRTTFAQFLDEVVNNGDLDVAKQIFHPDFVGLMPESEELVRGPEGAAEWATQLRAGFSDLNTLVEGGWLVCEDDPHHVGRGNIAQRVAGYVVLRGTHDGEYAGVPASGRHVTWGQVHLLLFKDGLIIHDQVVSDRLTLIQQMGAAGCLSSSITGPLIPAELI